MPLKLMYITNNTGVASIAEKSGVDRIFVDMEFIGKAARQTGMDSVQNHHSIEDVRAVRAVVSHSDLLVRVNPVHNRLTDYPSSEEEIESVIDAGADILVGHHTHTLQTIENYHGHSIYYSIGNYIFDQQKNLNSKACMVKIVVKPQDAEVSTIPVNIMKCCPKML